MTKHELLVPAGDMQSLYQAIHNGADAIYLGCKKFGARKFAKNFDNNEIIEAIKYAHLYGVKIYVTMNTLVKDNEVNDFLAQVEFLYKNNVDAIIVQDFGMICLIREVYPNLEIHASTQANTSSKETAELFYNLGVKRVVFSREMTLEEIETIDVPIEKEVFIHGALCISYSGCCLMSSMLGTRSGNRGECAGSCRLPYSLEKNNENVSPKKYLLSTKELNTAKNIDDLLKSSITSFKIEGRMKSPEYVGFITKYYRSLLDNKNIDLEEETDKLKTIFNREFTTGNLFNTPSSELMNNKNPNHIGLEIGQVIKVTPKKIKIKLNKPLNQQDGIRFLNSGKGFIVNFLYDEDNKLTNTADNICYVDNKINLTTNDTVCKTQDYKFITSLQKLPEKKIPIEYKVKSIINEPLEITITDKKNTITVTGNIVEQSINSPITEDRIKEQLGKLGNTPFELNSFEIKKDNNIFISVKELNDLKRNLIEQLSNIRQSNKKEFIKRKVTFNSIEKFKKEGITASVFTEEQLLACLSLNISRIYIEDLNLYEQYKKDDRIFYKLPRCTRNPKVIEKNKNLVSDYYIFTPNNKYIADYSLNVSNIYTIYYLQKLNVENITLSVELTETEISTLFENYKQTFNDLPNTEIVAYGRVENMLIKGNIINIEEDDYKYNLIDFKNRKFPVYFDGTNTHILNYENKNINNENILANASSIRLIFFNENETEIKAIVNKYS